MAVYTHVSAEEADALVGRYGLGRLRSIKGIAEGVENSNYLLDTDRGRALLTLYERRVDPADLPFFLDLVEHLAGKGLPVPATLRDREGTRLQTVAGKTAVLVEYLDGVSVSAPTPAQAHAVGAMLAAIHNGVTDFAGTRSNTLGLDGWRQLAEKCGPSLDQIEKGLSGRVFDELEHLENAWPFDLPRSVIHADLFPDNVLMQGEDVTGIIDFYFACTELTAWDLAVTHAAWCFSGDGTRFFAPLGDALVAGYRTGRALSPPEDAAFATLARGACLRFLLTRAWDWINTPPDALVTRKDPIAFRRRLDFYASL